MAVELFQRATDLGEAEAMSRLGLAYVTGEGGLPTDKQRAVKLFRRAAAVGNVTAIST